ncbi:hypothetical protein A6F55_23790 [Prescottella equi]|uniref:helix-turn-helix transcriptional regulator n=1 Tax=Rhodococcus hoagii TaxID=43767 RepID=UPI000A0FC519|nr:hypothetical protein [Prescottella equi]ORJ92588.1 hypothetical protein A6F55_23790 [Prescottella equi]
MTDLLDIDTDEYVTLREAMRLTGRSRPTILRWAKAGAVTTMKADGVVGYSANDLRDAEARAHQNLMENQVNTAETH